MRKLYLLSSQALLLAILMGCQDVFEDDLSDLQVQILAPADGALINQQQIQLVWEEIQDADNYRIVLVKPGFDNLQTVVLDSIVDPNIFEIQLQDGSYEWKVRANNAGSSTQYSVASFNIQSGESLGQVDPTIVSPLPDEVLGSQPVTLSWEPMLYAEMYVQILELENNGVYELVQKQVTSAQELVFEDLVSGHYRISLFATNSVPSISNTVETWFTLDLDAPIPATLESPEAEYNWDQSNDLTIQWIQGVDDLTGSVDSLFISELNVPSNIYIQELAEGNIVLTPEDLETGNYQWWVKTTDEAGNSSLSMIRPFSISE